MWVVQRTAGLSQIEEETVEESEDTDEFTHGSHAIASRLQPINKWVFPIDIDCLSEMKEVNSSKNTE